MGIAEMGRVNTRNRFFKSMIYFSTILLIWTFLATLLAKGLIVEKKLHQADAIVVLAGSAAYIERTHKAALSYKQGVAPSILLTDDGGQAGWSQREQRTPPIIDLAKRELIAEGVPEGAITILAPKVSGTVNEAELLSKIAADNRWKSLLIVTSAYHSRRSLRIFERAFANGKVNTNIGIVYPAVGQQSPRAFSWWLSPNGWKAVAGEYVKSVYYYFNY